MGGAVGSVGAVGAGDVAGDVVGDVAGGGVGGALVVLPEVAGRFSFAILITHSEFEHLVIFCGLSLPHFLHL